MKSLLRSLVTVVWFGLLSRSAADPSATDTPAIRQQLVQVILTNGPAQQKILGALGETGSKLVGDVLSAWTRGGVYLYPAADGALVPVTLVPMGAQTARLRRVTFPVGAAAKK